MLEYEAYDKILMRLFEYILKKVKIAKDDIV
jgi:hypothetical protein